MWNSLVSRKMLLYESRVKIKEQCGMNPFSQPPHCRQNLFRIWSTKFGQQQPPKGGEARKGLVGVSPGKTSGSQITLSTHDCWIPVSSMQNSCWSRRWKGNVVPSRCHSMLSGLHIMISWNWIPPIPCKVWKLSASKGDSDLSSGPKHRWTLPLSGPSAEVSQWVAHSDGIPNPPGIARPLSHT